jgi:hypothetical protein
MEGPLGREKAMHNEKGRMIPWLVTLLLSLPIVNLSFGQAEVSFRARRDFAVGRNPSSISVRDFNGDAILDLAVANTYSDTVSVLLGRGGGLFDAASTIAVGRFPLSIHAGDFNGDGRLDLAVVNGGQLPNRGSLSMLLGNGDGTFRPLPPLELERGTGPAAVGDFNGDGRPDFAIAYQNMGLGSANLAILLGNGDGTFRFPPDLIMRVADSPASLIAGQFNRDGLVDLALVNALANTVSIFFGLGNGRFRAGPVLSVGALPRFITSADFNGDARADLAVLTSEYGMPYVFLGNGDGTFRAAPPIRVGERPSSIAVDDFNGDGYLDMAVSNQTSNLNRVLILLGRGDGTFQEAESPVSVGVEPSFVAVGDLNDDGYPDLVVANALSGTVSIALGLGDGRFYAAPSFAVADRPLSMKAHDFDGDKIPDLAVLLGDRITILLGRVDGTFRGVANFAVGFRPSAFVIDDFDGDTIPDLAVANENSNNISIGLGLGDGTFRAAPTVAVPGDLRGITSGDFNGDMIPDLAVAKFYFRSVAILLGNGDGTFQAAPTVPVSGQATSITVADFDGDEQLDLAVSNIISDNIDVLLGNGDGTFQPFRSIPARGPTAVAAHDFNGDAIPDLAAASSSGIVIQLGNGDGTFRAMPTVPLGSDISSFAVGDFNGDDVPDLAVTNYLFNATTVSVVLGLGDGTFQGRYLFGVGTSPHGATVEDFNGDGRLDLAVANLLSNNISVLINDTPSSYGIKANTDTAP